MRGFATWIKLLLFLGVVIGVQGALYYKEVIASPHPHPALLFCIWVIGVLIVLFVKR